MRQLFVGKGLIGFGKLASYSVRQMTKSKEELRREQILYFWKKHGLAATIDAFHVKRSTLYLWRQKQKEGKLAPQSRRPHHVRQPTTSDQLIKEVRHLRQALPYLGKAKIGYILRRRGLTVSDSTVGRIITREKLPGAPGIYTKRKRKRGTKKLRKPSGYRITHPGDLVSLDTVTVQDGNRKKYLITAIDYYSRLAVAWTYKSPSSKNAANLLWRIQVALGTKIKAVNTDNGSEFLCNFQRACRKRQIQHFFTYPRSPKMNPLSERFNRTIQEEPELPTVDDPLSTWNKKVADYLIQYNFIRPHHSLQYLTPAEKLLGEKSNMLWTHTTYSQLLQNNINL